jgi:sugar phosphate isomerase/epimerase
MTSDRIYGINILGDPEKFPVTEQIRMVAQVGFGSFFTHWNPSKTEEWANTGAKNGLSYASIHAPCHETPALWRTGAQGDAALLPLLDCVRDCARFAIPVMVIHPSIGYVVPQDFTAGLSRYGRLLEEAERLGVVVGFENLESEECLAAVMSAFWHSPACGFCLDTGHEHCHNHGKDMMAPYGEKLCMVHLNDNHGRWAPESEPALWKHNDMHLPPGDGIVNWPDVMRRIAASPYRGPMMAELKLKTVPGRTDHDRYNAMPPDEFYALALARLQAVCNNQSFDNKG